MARKSISDLKRINYAFAVIVFAFLLIVGCLFHLQIISGSANQERALSQWVSDMSMTAVRGKIYDTNGNVLAQSSTVYKIIVRPPVIKIGERERIAHELSILLGVEEKTIYDKVCNTKIEEAIIKRQVDASVVDKITELKLGNGVVAAVDTKRFYPQGSLLSQVLGFTTTDGEGQSGLEKSYNKYLMGEDGRMISETDARGNTIAYGAQEYIQPINGNSITLTVDSVIQSFLEKALKEAVEVNKAENAQGIIMNAKTGEIIAISTQPDYDPNEPPRSDIDLLNKLSRNKIVADAYEPGSTFKILTLASALESGAVNSNTTFDCPGYKIVNGQKIKCWKSGGHQHQTLAQAVANSCNPAFMSMALSMGTEEFYDYLYAFGLGSPTGSDLPGESGGIVTHEKYIKDTDLARIGFGQSIAVTPIQLVTAVSAAVNGGNLMQPYIVKNILSYDDKNIIKENKPTVVRRVISESTSQAVREILENVVENGSGKNAKIPGYRVGGKTGTAQKYENGSIASGKLIASFIGFAPADDPEFVCLILVDEPKVGTIFGSTVAAPFVKDVLEETLQYRGYKPVKDIELVEVPDLSGKTTGEAARILGELGLEAIYQDADEVTHQLPRPNQKVAKGSSVLLYTASTDVQNDNDGQTVAVPNLIGMTRLQALDALQARGLKMELSDDSLKGTVAKQSIAADRQVKIGTVITVELTDKKEDDN